MTTAARFLWGFAGSAAVEVVTLFQRYRSGAGQLPTRYRDPVFWLIRVLLAIAAGALAVAYGVDQPLLAFNIGAATPLIIRTLSETPPDQGASGVRSILGG